MQQQHSSLNLNSSTRKYELEADISQSAIADEVSKSLRQIDKAKGDYTDNEK